MEIQRPIPERIPDVLIWCIREALRDELGYAVNCQKSDIMVMDGQNMITVQYYYYEKYNKCFIEYEIGPSIKPNLGNLDNFKTRILRYIDQNFDYDVYIYPDVVFYDQDISQITDTSHKLTPFTIGCWRCIDGSYEYLYDKASVMNDMRTDIPTMGKYSDRRFSDFITSVESIRNKYDQTFLNSKQTDDYIQENADIYIKYHDTEEYENKVKELNEKYDVKTGLNSMIPDIYKEYCKAYNEFFGKELPELIEAERFYINVLLK